MIPSRYPSVGILDEIATPEDLAAIFELEGWTNDRISNELGILHTISPEEWVTAQPMATVIMGAFCHPRPSWADASMIIVAARGIAASRSRPRTRRRSSIEPASSKRLADGSTPQFRWPTIAPISTPISTTLAGADFPLFWGPMTTAPPRKSRPRCWKMARTESCIRAYAIATEHVLPASDRDWLRRSSSRQHTNIDGRGPRPPPSGSCEHWASFFIDDWRCRIIYN